MLKTSSIATPAPLAEKRSSRRSAGRETWNDDYFWLRDRDDPAVLAYLEAENDYCAALMAPTESFQDQLRSEMIGRLVEDDTSAPVVIDDFVYYRRTVKGQEHPIFCRRRRLAEPLATEAVEEVLLDPNLLKVDYVEVGAIALAPDQRRMAFTLDLDGSEIFQLHLKDLESGATEILPIPRLAADVVWSEAGETLFLVERDAAQRPFRVLRLDLVEKGDAVSVFEEQDERFFVSIEKTRSRRFLVITSESHTTSELLVLESDRPESEFRPLFERRPGVEARGDHQGDFFYLVTNDQAENFRLVRVPVTATVGEWQEVVPHRPGFLLLGIDAFARHLVLTLRREGLRRIDLIDAETLSGREIVFEDPVHVVEVGENEMYDPQALRLVFSSLKTPPCVIDIDFMTLEQRLVKQTEVRGGFDPSSLCTERLWVEAGDGAKIPVSLVYRRDFVKDGRAPALLYGYGAYGHTIEPRFSSQRLCLLERGFVYAIAHVRGGEDLGRRWYLDGKLAKKANSFADFEAVADFLVDQGFCAREKLAIRGGSAGGLLIGAVLNRRPDLCAAALAEVPFVDVLNTMLDATLPLTVGEYEEWGDPASSTEVFERIRAYSPYDNVARLEIPALLVTAGLFDPRVSYWEPAKWVARLRAEALPRGPLLLRTEMRGGHRGLSGRYQALAEEAFKQAFLMFVLGLDRS
jgi:oligopeptidase B